VRSFETRRPPSDQRHECEGRGPIMPGQIKDAATGRYGNYVAQRQSVAPQAALVAMGTDRQMNLTNDRSDHPASHFETLVGRLRRVAIVGYKERPAALTNRARQQPHHTFCALFIKIPGRLVS
jgi:hypothetical protein